MISRRPRCVAALGLLALIVAACAGTRPDAPRSEAVAATSPTAATVETTDSATGGACVADPAWIDTPSFPAEVPDDSICGFDQFAWQALLYLVQPTSANPDVLNFESWMPHYGIFVPAGEQPVPWGEQPPDPCNPPATLAGAETGEAPLVYSQIIKQAGVEHPLMAPDGEYVWYAMSVNQPAYTMLTACDLYRSDCAGALTPGNVGKVDIVRDYPGLAFPDGAAELKTSWKVLSETEASSGLFYAVPGWIQSDDGSCRKETLGLAGIHVVAKTPSAPAMIWATFEHRNNAPDCSDLDADPPLGGTWNFFDRATCDNCTTNDYEIGKPAQICRMHPWGDSTIGTFPAGQDCAENPNQFVCQEATRTMLAESTAALRELDASVRELITGAVPGTIDPVWANYQLVGNVWTRDGVTPPQVQAQVGSLSAANTSMESFVQNGPSGRSLPYGCFSCHNQESGDFGQNLPQVGLSHLFDDVAPKSGGCADGALPAACEPFTSH